MTVLILPLKAFICLRNKFKKEVLNLFKLICGKQKDRRIHQKEHFLNVGNAGSFPWIYYLKKTVGIGTLLCFSLKNERELKQVTF